MKQLSRLLAFAVGALFALAMIRVHAESRSFDYKYQTNAAAVIPYHPGAVKYYRRCSITSRCF